jgi:hypothetical protein
MAHDNNREDQSANGAGQDGPRSANERERRLGLFIVEVVRATYEGRVPITQVELRKALKKNWRLDLPGSTSTNLCNILKRPFRNKTWLIVDGHKVTLFSEDETLADFRAAKAVLLGRDNINEDFLIDIGAWRTLCKSKHKLSCNVFDEFLDDIIRCRYVVRTDAPGIVEFDPRAIGEDEFYLTQAAKAGIKKSTARTKQAKQ